MIDLNSSSPYPVPRSNGNQSIKVVNVARVWSQLSAHIMFEGGVFACLEYLEAVPWADEEEEKVTALMGQLQLESVGVAADVMKRCSALESTNSEDVLVRLLQAVTKGLPCYVPRIHSCSIMRIILALT